MEYEKKVPEFLLGLLKEQYSFSEIEKIISGYSVDRRVTIRINTLKNSVENIKKVLEDNKIEYFNVPWSNYALIIRSESENKLKMLDIYEKGEIYLQSLSSMLPPIILEPCENEDILDMASAPRKQNYTNCYDY